MTDIVVSILIVTGSFFMFLAAVGVARMRDLYMRMSALTKAPTMGVGLLLVVNVIVSPELEVIFKALAIVGLGFFASPIAAHMIGRAAYFQGVALWEGTLLDELRDRYDPRSHEPAPVEPHEFDEETIQELMEGEHVHGGHRFGSET